MTKGVAVLGCGPAGLLAAHAATLRGREVTIYSTRAPSRIGGAQFLHRSIDGLTSGGPDGVVSFQYIGTKSGYAKKVYGHPDAEVSWGNYGGLVQVWNMQEAYAELWRRYNGIIRDVRVSTDFLYHLLRGGHEAVFSCIPRSSICVSRLHRFETQDVWIADSSSLEDMTILYNGEGARPWYRSSTIFGHQGTEFPLAVNAPLGSVRVKKPLRTDCRCWMEHSEFIPLGRYGRWEKKVLIHHAYEGVLEALA